MSATPLLVDDHLLLRILLGEEPDALRPDGGPIFTTGLWYHRLCRALAVPAVIGSMSRLLGDAGATVAGGVVGSVTELPEAISLVSLRSLAWPMAEVLAAGPPLNLLALEAVAAALHLDAEICVARDADSPPLRAAAAVHGVGLRLVG